MADKRTPRRTADLWVEPMHGKQQRGKLDADVRVTQKLIRGKASRGSGKKPPAGQQPASGATVKTSGGGR